MKGKGFLDFLFGFQGKEERIIERQVLKDDKRSKNLKKIQKIASAWNNIKRRDKNWESKSQGMRGLDWLKTKEGQKYLKIKEKLASEVNLILEYTTEDLEKKFNTDDKILLGLTTLGRYTQQIQKEIEYIERHGFINYHRDEHLRQGNMSYEEWKESCDRQNENYINKIQILKEKLEQILEKRKLLWEQLGEDLAAEFSAVHVYAKMGEFAKS